MQIPDDFLHIYRVSAEVWLSVISWKAFMVQARDKNLADKSDKGNFR